MRHPFYLPVRAVFAMTLLLVSSSHLSAQISYASGTFVCNAPATISCRVVSLASGILDTTIEYHTGAGNSVAYTLPVSITVGIATRDGAGAAYAACVSGDRVVVTLPTSFAGQTIRLLDLSGRSVSSATIDARGSAALFVGAHAMGVRLLHIEGAALQTARLVIQGTDAYVHLNAPSYSSMKTAMAAAGSARYSITVTSNGAGYDNLAAQTLDFSEGVGGQKTFVLPASARSASDLFKELVDETGYSTMFPHRYRITDLEGKPLSGATDFYTYSGLCAAIDSMAKIEVEVWHREGLDYCHKLVWRNKLTGQSRTMINNADYNAEWNLTKTEKKDAVVDYAKFCAEGTLTTRRQELAAFLGNISHETTGGWADAPGGQYSWGLYFREEVGYEGGGGIGYVDNGNAVYPPTAGKSYHGRGPIQVTWNYNYGQCSEFLFGDKQVLLDRPERMIEEASVAFMSAIWFWMTPQAPKPSCHDVMAGNWIPTADDIAKKRDTSKFGMTINIINGGLECGQGDGQSSPTDRAGYYRNYIGIMGETAETYCDCGAMSYW